MEATVKIITLVDGTILEAINVMETINNNGQNSLRFQLVDFSKDLKELYALFTKENCAMITIEDKVLTEESEKFELAGYNDFNIINKSYETKYITVNINKVEETENENTEA